MHDTQDLLAKLRGYRRLPEILAVLIKHGFRDALDEIGLGRLAKITHRSEVTARAERRPVHLRRAAEELGPTFVKLGQVVSLRPDLIPEDYAEELRKLHDACEPVPFEQISAKIQEELGDRFDELFASLEPEPVAAASVAQVHRAVLRNGERVVIKVLRPGIRRILAADIELLTTLAQFMEQHLSNPGFSPTRVVGEFSEELRRELDLTIEGKSTDRLRRFFFEDPDVLFPRVHWSATTESLLTLEEIEGQTLARIEIDGLSAAERRQLVAIGTRAVFQQCLELGFFHADPHPGNLMWTAEGRLCFIDCGMVGHLDHRTRGQLADLIAALAREQIDLDRVIQTALALGGGDPALAEDRSFRQDTWQIVSRLENLSLDSLELGTLLQDFFSLLRRHDVRCPSDLVLLIKAIVTIESVAQDLDPAFDLVDHVRPQIETLLAERYGMAALRRRFEQSVARYSELVERFPDDIGALLDQIRRNTFRIHLEHERLEALTATLEHASRNIAYAFIIAALVVSSSILVLADRMRGPGGALTTIGTVGLMGSAVLIVLLVIANFRRSR